MKHRVSIVVGILALGIVFISNTGFATPTGKSDLVVKGIKWPNYSDPNHPDFEGTLPIETFAIAPLNVTTGYTKLIPYIMRSPDQDEAGSCLYMSLTGIVEWWLHKLDKNLSFEPDGPGDLSERYLMNLAGVEESGNGVTNWKTDSIFLFNWNDHKSVLNKDYRFTKDWYKEDAQGNYTPAVPNSEGASFGTYFNWIDQSKTISTGFVTLPNFERNVIFADPESDQWNVGVTPEDIVEKVKQALVENNAPVHVIYNHFAYWHAVMIVGFDDDRDSESCNFVERTRKYMTEQPPKLRLDAEKEGITVEEKDRLLKRALKLERTSQKLEASYKTRGGCHKKGMFYVRDSIYADPEGPVYDYNTSTKGDEAPYSKTVILHEYDWLRYLANHITQIVVE